MKGAALALPALAAGAFFLLSGKAKAAPKPPVIVPSPQGSGTVAERMARVIASGDPAAIRFEAGRLRQEGYTSQASELERVAATIEAERAKPPVPIPGMPPSPVKPPLTPPAPPVVIVTPPAVVPLPVPVPSVLLKRGSPAGYDARVQVVQARLIALGYSVGASGADGKFGAGTEAAVKAFQSSNGLKPVDGIVGPVTQAALMSPTAKGPALTVVKPPAVKPPPVVVMPTPVLPAGPPPPSSAAAGRAPTITPALRSLPALLRNGKATKPPFKAPASSGQAVKDWQQVLFDLGFTKAKPDGKFGDATEAATRAFQAAANSAAAKSSPPKKPLTVDGIVGPATVARAAEARIVTTGPAAFTGDHFGYDPGPMRAPLSPLADSPLPGVIPPMLPPAPDPERALAARVTHMLVTATPGREDRTLVAMFQQRHGLKPTGFYGPAVALTLAQRYGIVPPKPLYWTESRTSKSKSNYRDALRMIAERDPQRAEEWIRAGAV